MKKLIFILLLLIYLAMPNLMQGQTSVPLDEVENKLTENPKYIVIEFYTDWCGICAIQQNTIRKDEDLVGKLENEFYYVKFNAETKDSFRFYGYLFENKNRIHDFAKAFFPDELGFPAWVILNRDMEIVFQWTGLMESDELDFVLKQIL